MAYYTLIAYLHTLNHKLFEESKLSPKKLKMLFESVLVRALRKIF